MIRWPSGIWFLCALLMLTPVHALSSLDPASAIEDAASRDAGAAPSAAPSRIDAAIPLEAPLDREATERATVARPNTASQALGARDIEFYCPWRDDVGGIPLPDPSAEDPTVSGCPTRIYDTAWSFGNTKIAVNDDDHQEVAFFSLHGAPSQRGPHSYSRQGDMTHVTFTSSDYGRTWEDQPTQGYSNPGVGDYASGAMDSQGNLYAGYLWQVSAGEAWEGSAALFKGPTAAKQRGMIEAYYDPATILTRDIGNAIVAFDVINLPSHSDETPPEANETAPPAGEDHQGESSGTNQNATEERMVATWHEAAADWRTSTTGLSGWIDAAWTDTGPHNMWTRLNATQAIGPCSAGSNPAAWNGRVYVACVVDRGYADRSRAKVGDVDLWSIDVYDGTTRLEGWTRINGGGRPSLAVNEDGYMVVLLQDKEYDSEGVIQRLTVETAFGWYGQDNAWTRMGGDIGRQLRRAGGGADEPLRDADITALILTSDEPTAAFVYKEWLDDPQVPTGVDPDDPRAFIGNRLTDYNKYLVTFNSCSFPIAAAQMELGTAVDSYNADAYAQQPGLFNDVQDGLAVTRMPNGEELVYFAISDYGAMQYGAFLAGGAADFCAVIPPLITPVPPALPQAISLSNAMTTAAGAGVAVSAAAMVTYLLTVKRRVAHFVGAEDN